MQLESRAFLVLRLQYLQKRRHQLWLVFIWFLYPGPIGIYFSHITVQNNMLKNERLVHGRNGILIFKLKFNYAYMYRNLKIRCDFDRLKQS